MVKIAQKTAVPAVTKLTQIVVVKQHRTLPPNTVSAKSLKLVAEMSSNDVGYVKVSSK